MAYKLNILRITKFILSRSLYIMKLRLVLITVIPLAVILTSCGPEQTDELPNILWLVSEDNSTFFGCYGDDFATTPNFDKLASEGVLYTHAFANAPVCAPARSTIITGCYASSTGTLGMRSNYTVPDFIKFLPEFLKEKGYYCTNCAKQDYNMIKTDKGWDESSREASFRNRPDNVPFFHVQNFGVSHESSLHNWQRRASVEDLVHDPAKVKLPPYHPDIPEMRNDWAWYYDVITILDTQIGEYLQQLEDEGLAENTIVIYYGDHGGVVGRSKRYVYESGTHVPMIIRIPEKYRHLAPGKPGSKEDRIVSFVDLMPTMLSLTGIEIPDYVQGKAFLGKQKTKDPEYAFLFRERMDERIDMVRAVRDQQYRYIRNYMPYRPALQKLDYLWKAESMTAWHKAWQDGECNEVQSRFFLPKPSEELYDVNADPWEVNNLIDDPAYQKIKERMSLALDQYLENYHDAGFIPEGERSRKTEATTSYEYFRSDNYNEAEVQAAAKLAVTATTDDISTLTGYFENENSEIRFWGATGLLILGEDARGSLDALKKLTSDESYDVRNVAAEALYHLGEHETAFSVLTEVLEKGNQMEQVRALNAIDFMDEGELMKEYVADIIERSKNQPVNHSGGSYNLFAAKNLLLKWEE
jgi:N-sulfoglucosamine sulfohydrolase